MGLDGYGLALRLPFPAAILVFPDHSFFLVSTEIAGNLRRQMAFGQAVDVLELSIAIGMLLAFEGLGVRLEAIAKLL